MVLQGQPARLVYVMGPSGAGKDSVLRYARRELDGRYPVLFAHRYITRPRNDDTEDYIALSPGEFELRRGHGLFAFDWDAYGWRYAIGSEIGLWCAAGLIVVIDGSRHHFIEQRATLTQVLPVLITAPADILRQRLIARKREAPAAIETRLERSAALQPVAPTLVTIDNGGRLEDAGSAFATLLRQLAG